MLYSEFQPMSLRVKSFYLSPGIGMVIELTSEGESEARIGCIAKLLT